MPSATAKTRQALRCGSTSIGSSPLFSEGTSTADLLDHGRGQRSTRCAAVIIGLVITLAACGRPGGIVPPNVSETTITDTRATRLSKPPSVPRTLTRTASPTGSAGTPVVVPDPTSHRACRLLDLNDLPADVRPADPPRYETFSNDPDQCRIDDSLYEINPGETESIVWFRATVIVSHDLSPIDGFVGVDAESTGQPITLGGQRAVERLWTNEPRCRLPGTRSRTVRRVDQKQPVPAIRAVRSRPFTR